jgi:hypothetical protein
VLPVSGTNPIRVQASTNLADWLDIGFVTSTNGAMGFIDVDAERYPSRFYRLVCP